MNLCKVVVLVLLIFINQNVKAQIFPAKNYPKNYFIWPVKATPALAANFGESTNSKSAMSALSPLR